ncbi:MAG: Pilus assembly protein, PilO [Candidatus Omnitrophica bacterium ADurb.Bin205]|nr:MAG: Pilus assembly protein, PilO [Candidatus Omnitrophica bacterium ADurb.Bin205]
MKNLIEKINKLNLMERFSLDNKKLTLIFIVSAMVIYLDFNFLLKNQASSSARMGKEITRIKNDMKALDTGLKKMQEARAVKAGPKVKSKKVIFEPELPALLNDISKLANFNNVRITQIKPARDLQKSPAKFSPVLISMDIIGGYHNFGRFINSLENNEVLMSVEGFKIEPLPKDPLRQKIAVTVKTYVRK